MSEWIKYPEKMPKENSFVVIADIGYGEIYCAAAAWFINGRFSLMDGLSASNYDGGACIDIDMQITHWMPLPEPPDSQ